MPLCTIDIAIVGKKGEFAIAIFLASCEDVDTIGRCRTIALVFVCLPIYNNTLLALAWLAWIAWRTAIERESDGIEQRRFAATCRAYDAEDGAIAERPFFEIDHFTTLAVERGQIEDFKLQDFHVSSDSDVMELSNAESICSWCSLISLFLTAKASLRVSRGLRFRMSSML